MLFKIAGAELLSHYLERPFLTVGARALPALEFSGPAGSLSREPFYCWGAEGRCVKVLQENLCLHDSRNVFSEEKYWALSSFRSSDG